MQATHGRCWKTVLIMSADSEENGDVDMNGLDGVNAMAIISLSVWNQKW